MKLRRLTMIPLALALATTTLAAEKPEEGVVLTIYNQNFGVVRERRKVDVPEKIGTVEFADVASQIDGTSVHFKSLTGPSATVLEQNYEYDLVSADKLLEKYVDKQIAVLTKDGSRYSGKLLSFDANQLVIRQDGEKSEIVMVQRGDNVKDVQFGALPEGFDHQTDAGLETHDGEGGPTAYRGGVPDGRHQLACRLQRRAESQRHQARSQRLGHDQQSVGRDIQGREAEAYCRRCAARTAAPSAFCASDAQGDDG